MEREIVLSSYNSEGEKNPANFVTKFQNPIILESNHQHMVGLNRIINMSFTWTNINSGYKKQLIKYSKDSGVSFTDISFSKGVWTYILINEHIKKSHSKKSKWKRL